MDQIEGQLQCTYNIDFNLTNRAIFATSIGVKIYFSGICTTEGASRITKTFFLSFLSMLQAIGSSFTLQHVEIQLELFCYTKETLKFAIFQKILAVFAIVTCNAISTSYIHFFFLCIHRLYIIDIFHVIVCENIIAHMFLFNTEKS